MAANSFRFLDLPPEIRDETYTLLLPQDRKLRIDTYSMGYGVHLLTIDGERPSELARLLRLNQQLLRDVAPVLYGLMTFRFYLDEQMRRWLR